MCSTDELVSDHCYICNYSTCIYTLTVIYKNPHTY